MIRTPHRIIDIGVRCDDFLVLIVRVCIAITIAIAMYGTGSSSINQIIFALPCFSVIVSMIVGVRVLWWSDTATSVILSVAWSDVE